MLLSVTTHSSFIKSVVMSISVSKVGVVPCRAWNERSIDSIGGISYHLNKCYLLSNTVSMTILFCLSATQLMHAPVHGVRNTVQQLLSKTLNFISPELWSPTGQSWTQLITRYRKSIPAWIWVSSQQNWRNLAATGWTLEKQ